jgi:hypothetical protein
MFGREDISRFVDFELVSGARIRLLIVTMTFYLLCLWRLHRLWSIIEISGAEKQSLGKEVRAFSIAT